MPSHLLKLLAPLIVLSGLCCGISGCATLVEGSSQVVRIETDPSEASCAILRNGQVVSTIPSTPATVSVFKEKGALRLRCNKPGYLQAELQQTAEFSGTVIGNIFFGGLVGAAIDMGSGATHKYPEMVVLTLIPEHFPDAKARDAFFSALLARVEERHRQSTEKKRRECKEDDCSAKLEELERSFEATLRNIEQQRQQARLDDPNEK